MGYRMRALKLCPCSCGGKVEIKKVAQNGDMDGTYWDWKLTCKKCGSTRIYAADGFYGRKYKTLEEVVDDWNRINIPYLMHKELDIPISDCQKAYDAAIDYLRSQGKLRGGAHNG